MGKTYTNEIREDEVSLAIEHLLIAPVGTAAPAGRIDVASLGTYTNFTHLGGVVEDTPSVTINREKYQLETGIPRTLQYDATVAMSGQFTVSFYSNSNKVVRYALGNVPPSFVYTGAVTSILSTAISFSNRTLAVTINTTGYAVGDMIVLNASAGTTPSTIWSDSYLEGYVESKTTNQIILRSFDGTPTFGTTVGVIKVAKTVIPFGTSQIPKYYIIGVADFIDGVQIQHHLYKASPVGDFTETVQPGQAGMIAATWDLFATTSTSYNNGSSELILGERFYYPRNT